ncbi:MAG: DUF167 domain-containing protein [Bacillota bacterium]|nr:DUF167 domain-containing protein [Bacillota bacterium]
MSGSAALFVRERPGGLVFPVRVQPKSSRNELVGITDGALWIKVTAPPVAGQANRATLALLADLLGVPASALALTGGARSRNKQVQISGVTADHLRSAIDRALTRREGAD